MTIQERLIQGEVLLIDKEYKWTSFDVVNKIRWIIKNQLGIKKIKAGHAGTLDPLATGLVIIFTGKATKKTPEFIHLDKEYVFKMKLGETTPSLDLETEVSFVKDPKDITLEQVIAETEKYVGDILQAPPVFSAKYLCGTRAYEFARKGIMVEMDPVPVKINAIEVQHFENPFVTVRVSCGKGTYIRSLARDIGNGLGCGAYLAELRRTSIGNYHVKDAMTITKFEETIHAL